MDVVALLCLSQSCVDGERWFRLFFFVERKTETSEESQVICFGSFWVGFSKKNSTIFNPRCIVGCNICYVRQKTSLYKLMLAQPTAFQKINVSHSLTSNMDSNVVMVQRGVHCCAAQPWESVLARTNEFQNRNNWQYRSPP